MSLLLFYVAARWSFVRQTPHSRFGGSTPGLYRQETLLHIVFFNLGVSKGNPPGNLLKKPTQMKR